MRLLVLAGGFGTRLKAAVADVPKALAPIGDVPFLRLQIEHWRSQGLREFTFLLYHQADQIISFLQAQQGQLLKDCQVDWLIEPAPMDTGGALAHAAKTLCLKDNFLMTNADTGDNFFIIKDGVVITPEGRNILRGISRDYVMKELTLTRSIPKSRNDRQSQFDDLL